jgi:hypothetical protein
MGSAETAHNEMSDARDSRRACGNEANAVRAPRFGYSRLRFQLIQIAAPHALDINIASFTMLYPQPWDLTIVFFFPSALLASSVASWIYLQ